MQGVPKRLTQPTYRYKPTFRVPIHIPEPPSQATHLTCSKLYKVKPNQTLPYCILPFLSYTAAFFPCDLNQDSTRLWLKPTTSRTTSGACFFVLWPSTISAALWLRHRARTCSRKGYASKAIQWCFARQPSDAVSKWRCSGSTCAEACQDNKTRMFFCFFFFVQVVRLLSKLRRTERSPAAGSLCS